MKLNFFFLAALLIVVMSCISGPVYIPEDMPPTKIIQLGQEATDGNKYKIAIQYYETLLERHGHIGEYYCTGEYEIAFIRYKQKRYAEARRGFENLLALYNEPGGNALPPQFRVLSEIVLARMNEKGF